MPSGRGRIIYVIIGAVWLAVVAFGGFQLWSYESTADTPAHPPLLWPAKSDIPRVAALPTLVLLAHPRCPCSRATMAELARLMTDCHEKVSANVLMLRPTGVAEGWERTHLWDSAAAIPGVSVIADADGAEARRFGAATSGQVLLYAADGRLLFSGGITESRGHEGDNAGRSAVTALVRGTASQVMRAPVFGCPLFDPSSTCPLEGSPECSKH